MSLVQKTPPAGPISNEMLVEIFHETRLAVLQDAKDNPRFYEKNYDHVTSTSRFNYSAALQAFIKSCPEFPAREPLPSRLAYWATMVYYHINSKYGNELEFTAALKCLSAEVQLIVGGKVDHESDRAFQQEYQHDGHSHQGQSSSADLTTHTGPQNASSGARILMPAHTIAAQPTAAAFALPAPTIHTAPNVPPPPQIPAIVYGPRPRAYARYVQPAPFVQHRSTRSASVRSTTINNLNQVCNAQGRPNLAYFHCCTRCVEQHKGGECDRGQNGACSRCIKIGKAHLCCFVEDGYRSPTGLFGHMAQAGNNHGLAPYIDPIVYFAARGGPPGPGPATSAWQNQPKMHGWPGGPPADPAWNRR